MQEDFFPKTIISPMGKISSAFIELGLTELNGAVNWVQQLPYGRNKDRSEYALVLTEKKGTCSTKHALLAALCDELKISSVSLKLGIYKMNEVNTPGIKKVLQAQRLNYLPEAHCYLSIEGKRVDITTANSSIEKIEQDILSEIRIIPLHIGKFKVDYHHNFLKLWLLKQQAIHYSFEEIWKIREQCIAQLSQ